MNVKLSDGRELFVRWIYDGKTTICRIYEGETDLISGIAHTADCDAFNKDTGRKISLQRATQALGLSKEDRRRFWEVYRNMPKKPRW